MVDGVKIDPDEISAGIMAAKEVVATFTYMGMSVGSHVTDAQYSKLVTAIVAAIEDWRNSKEI
jgi:hypothetical protein